MKHRKIVWLLLISSLLIVSCGQKEESSTEEKAKYVKIEKVANCQDQEEFVFNGKIHESSLSSLSFRVGGPLVKFDVEAGDYVQAGQIIAAIDKRDYQLQVKSTKAQYLQLKGEYERYKELHDKEKVPSNSFEKIESGYLMAKTAYENAVNQLNDTELKAPHSGYIHEKFTENFQTVGPGHPIVSIIDISYLEVVTSIPENRLLRIKECNNSYLDVKNARINKLPIEMISLGEKAKADGMYELRFRFKNNEQFAVSPGMSAEITMVCQSDEKSTKIPAEAVFYHNNSTQVWIFDPATQSIQKRSITTKNLAKGGMIEVTKGLQDQEMIVTAGVHSLSENQKVKAIEEVSETNIGGLL